MKLLSQMTFVCVDCEATGLDPENDRVIEVGAVRFTLKEILAEYETLINPEQPISLESQKIHHITDAMVKDKPKAEEVLSDIITFIGSHIVVGHGIEYDLKLLHHTAKRSQIRSTLLTHPSLDTLRLARLYGKSPKNSLEALRDHFNIPPEKAHRALDDARINQAVFQYLIHPFQTLEQIQKALSRPIRMPTMPLGKHKGKVFCEIPLPYLEWASHQNFDRDLMFSICEEIKKRKRGGQFRQAANPFQEL